MVYDLLPEGKANALSTEYLCSRLKISRRELRSRIEAERRNGLVILSRCYGKGGYFRPASTAEVKEFIKIENKRAFSILHNLKSAKDYLQEVENEDCTQIGGI